MLFENVSLSVRTALVGFGLTTLAIGGGAWLADWAIFDFDVDAWIPKLSLLASVGSLLVVALLLPCGS